jgi:DeoR/GlpR family transcriptional regulator of sugar metabolism
MTRSEIREAIKKVFFEEIEPDSLTKNNKTKQKHLNQTYKTLDGKYALRSRHEALAYNIFDNEGVNNQITPDDRQFLKTCRKIPDFVWESKKIIIEIAGMDDIIKPGYWKKLLEAKPCFEKQGYTVYIIDTRIGSLYYNYIRFYEHLCDLLGFTPKSEIKNDIFSYIGDPIDLIKRNQEIVQYKNNNPKAGPKEISNIFNTTPAIVFKILKQAGLTISQPQTQSQIQTRNQEIIQYKKDNPNATAKEIADKFNTTRQTINNIIFKAGLTTPLSQTQARNQEIIQYKKDNPKATYKEIADKFNTTVPTINNILIQAGLTISSSQTQARNQEIVQYKKDNPEATKKQIADKLNTTLGSVEYALTQAGLTTPLSQTQDKNQEIIQYKKDNPEATRKQIADKFNTTVPTIDGIIKKAGLNTSLTQIQTRNQEIIQYKKDNPNATAKEIAAKFNVSIDTIYLLFKPKKSNPTNEQSINHKTMTLKELREIIKKAMQESTIDVPGDPNKLTPQQKSAEISKARRTTRKPKLGTSEDPVDFI